MSSIAFFAAEKKLKRVLKGFKRAQFAKQQKVASPRFVLVFAVRILLFIILVIITAIGALIHLASCLSRIHVVMPLFCSSQAACCVYVSAL
jgi:hypothetical protein